MYDYDEEVMKRFKNPKFVGEFSDSDVSEGQFVATGEVGSLACGDLLRMQLLIDLKDEIIVDVRIRTFGCCAVIASSVLAAELVVGKSLSEVLKIKDKDIANTLSLPPIKTHCSVLTEEVLRDAMKNYQEHLAKTQAAGCE